MHQIKKLNMVGFKSFCDRTHAFFNEGVTAIVGPNGCGKSNIADAISWVVGEQSAKSLRTDRMEGVIFNGTQARKATGMAEVTLTMSLGKNFPLPEGLNLDTDEFSVGRRLYRSGESEYYLDGRRCRLKDIQALFEGTGLGPNSYALIEQGRIGQILSSRPSDRRSLIEEAARITLFKSRRYTAEVKLEQAQNNLMRVSDIIREVARQLNSLRRQAAKARRYARLREELRLVHRLKMAQEGRRVSQSLADCSVRFNAALEQEKAILDALAQLEAERSGTLAAERAEEGAVHEMRERLEQLRLELGRLESLRQSHGAQAEALAARITDLDREVGAIGERAELVARELQRIGVVLETLEADLAGDRQTLEAEQARADLTAAAIRSCESQIEEVRSFLLNGAGMLSDLKNQQARSAENIERLGARVGKLTGELAAREHERSALRAELVRLGRRNDELFARRNDVRTLQEAWEGRSSRVGAQIESTTTELAARQEEYSLMQHRFSSLEEIEHHRSNYSEGVQKYLSAHLPGEESRRTETLADHIETDPRFEAAIEDYLNEPLQYILVEGMDDAVRSVDRLRRIGAGKCTFMTVRNGHPPGPVPERVPLTGEGVVGYLYELLRMREDLRHAFERALPDFASTVMVQDLQTAFRVAETNPGANYLTLSGEAYSPRGTLSAVGERKSMAGFLALKREKRELQAKLDALRVRIEEDREEVAVLRQEQATASELLKSLAEESQRIEVEAVGLEHQTERVVTDIDRLDQGDILHIDEIAQLEAEKTENETKLEEASRRVAEIEERSRTSGEDLRELTWRLESLRDDHAAGIKNLASLLSAHAVKEERRSAAQSEQKRLRTEAEETRRRREDNRSEKESAAARIGELEAALEQGGRDIGFCTAAIREGEEVFGRRQTALARRREQMSAIDERAKELHGRREDALGIRGRIEIEKTRLESDLEHLARACQEEFHHQLEHLGEGIEEEAWQRAYEEVVRHYDELRERVENFGAINMRALEEYQELDERYQFLTSQRADIEKSISDTQQAIAEINRRSVQQFQDAFQNIRRNFIEVFQILFSGGQCDLRLMDEGDLLESGIDIIAQPPGKRLQNILLLSGGEKALTALALLIAIFRFRPSPFCVLDEVDAPLDDANVVRFTQLIEELSKETQFIIITHNKRTMEAARTLYGVTMEEPGVSKIVSVDLAQPEEAIAV